MPFENHIEKLKKPTSCSKLIWIRTRLYTRKRFRIWLKNVDSLRDSTSPRPRLKTKPSRSSTPEVPLRPTDSITRYRGWGKNWALLRRNIPGKYPTNKRRSMQCRSKWSTWKIRSREERKIWKTWWISFRPLSKLWVRAIKEILRRSFMTGWRKWSRTTTERYLRRRRPFTSRKNKSMTKISDSKHKTKPSGTSCWYSRWDNQTRKKK